MSIEDIRLGTPPDDPGRRELWLQHAAGVLLMERARRDAIEGIDPALGREAQAAAIKAIDDALYGVMRLVDGDWLRNEDHAVELHAVIHLLHRGDDDEWTTVQQLDANEEGDGWCMAIHGWLEGDFGDEPPIEGVLPRQPPPWGGKGL